MRDIFLHDTCLCEKLWTREEGQTDSSQEPPGAPASST